MKSRSIGGYLSSVLGRWNGIQSSAAFGNPGLIVRIARGLAALLLLLGIVLPWVWMDDASRPYNGADMAVYLLVGSDRAFILSHSPLHAIPFLILPVIIVIITVLMAISCGWGCWDMKRTTMLVKPWHPLRLIIPVVAFLWAAAPVLDTKQPDLFGFPAPAGGMMVILSAAIMLTLLESWRRYRQRASIN